jgi:hypothetical protein
VQSELDFMLVAASDLGHGARPKNLAEDGRILKQALAVRR